MPADKRIDAYIAKSAPFAQPILRHLRQLVHAACPGVQETIKWGFPHFEVHGAILCSMAAFKQHCVFGFWKASLMKDTDHILTVKDRASMGHLGRITAPEDLPPDKILRSYIRQAAQLNEAGIKLPPRQKSAVASSPVEVPDYIIKALKKNAKARKTFEAFSPSHKREYIEWITEAKTGITRDKRIAAMIEWVGEGKQRNWKYESKK
jgi:uncharacterized protein YdeI (YjbR/CyaY-like superfamily)